MVHFANVGVVGIVKSIDKMLSSPIACFSQYSGYLSFRSVRIEKEKVAKVGLSLRKSEKAGSASNYAVFSLPRMAAPSCSSRGNILQFCPLKVEAGPSPQAL